MKRKMGRVVSLVAIASFAAVSCSEDRLIAVPAPKPPQQPAQPAWISGRVVPVAVEPDDEALTALPPLSERLLGWSPDSGEDVESRAHGLEGAIEPPSSGPGFLHTDEREPSFAPGRLVIRPAAGKVDGISTLNERPGLERYRFQLGAWASPTWVVVEIRSEAGLLSADETRALVPLLQAQPEIEAVELDHVREVAVRPSDPHYKNQWSLDLLRMDQAWEITTGSSDVVVAVLDQGIPPHPELGDRLLPGYDMCETNGLDGDGRDPDPSPSPHEAWVGRDVYAHGVLVAGIIGAVTNNGRGVAGMDWKAKILPVRVLTGGFGYMSDFVAGIYWAIGAEVPGLPLNPHPADVVNLSVSGRPLTPLEQEALHAAVEAGAIVVAAAGNDGGEATGRAFAGYDGVITVGATDWLGRRAWYSNWGKAVHVMAPGGDARRDRDGDGRADEILSLDLEDDRYLAFTGTSAATAFVSGLVALMKSIRPDLRYEEALSILQETANPVGRCAQGCGAGLIDPVRVLRALGGSRVDAPHKIEVFPDSIEARLAETASFRIRNPGKHALQWLAWVSESPGHSVKLSPDQGELGPGREVEVQIRFHREDLEPGAYRVYVVIQGEDEKRTVSVEYWVKDDRLQNIGNVWVLALGFGADGDVVVGGKGVARYLEGYRFEIEASPGAWYLLAWKDVNGDGRIDERDRMALLSDDAGPVAMQVGEGERIQDLALEIPFAYRPVSKPTPEPRETAPCEELRRCWEDCNWDWRCSGRCKVSAACRNRYVHEAGACLWKADCPRPGWDCCKDCVDEVVATFGEDLCGREIFWPLEGGLGAACWSHADCAARNYCKKADGAASGRCADVCAGNGACGGGYCLERARECVASCGGGYCEDPTRTCTEDAEGRTLCL